MIIWIISNGFATAAQPVFSEASGHWAIHLVYTFLHNNPYYILFSCYENKLNSDPKAEIVSNNLPLKIQFVLYCGTQKQCSEAPTWSNNYNKW